MPRPPAQGHGGRAVGCPAVPGGEGHPGGAGADGRRASQWRDGRPGPWAGRGFHFQEAVGAWLAAKVAAGSIRADAVVPEGLEDMSLEGEEPWHVQVKSRGEHLGPFPASKAAKHILDAWKRHDVRDEAGSSLLVVLERGVRAEPPSADLEKTLAESLSDGSRLLGRLGAEGERRGVAGSDIDRLLSSTVLVVISWNEIVAETVSLLGRLVEIPPAGLLSVANQLRVVVADASDCNAARDYGGRRVLGLTELVGTIERMAELVDSAWLNAAVKAGVCETLEYGYQEPSDDSGRFYEGEATQPFHVASGLVVHRPDVIGEISSGLEERSAVVITGPSGVGKSAVLWTLPRELPGVLWCRVRRLADEDVPLIVRLARSYLALPFSRVGFLVDSAGTGDFAGWARLRAEAAAVPGMLVVATARGEDLMTLGDLAECATVAVRLDEHAAETIHTGLVRRGATDAAHWREAFDQSGGLTLEFAHMLTRGQRLRDVIDGQIRRRIQEGRHHELEVLALASVANRWSAAVSTSDVARASGLSDFELREALERLDAEHLVVERNGRVEGLHRLRSTAICEAVHELPPPVLGETIGKVVPLVPTSQLHRFIAAMLSDNPDARGVVIEAACGEALESGRVAAYLQGLRLADFRHQANRWNEIAEQHSIPIAVRPMLFAFAVVKIAPPGVFPDEVKEAWEAMVATTGRASRDELLVVVGRSGIARLVTSTSDIRKATQLLAVLADADAGLAAAIAAAIADEPTLASALQEAPLKALADCVAAAYDAAPSLALSLMEAIGGETAVIQRIRADNPWITRLEVQEGDGGLVGLARFLYVSDSLQSDPDEEAHRLGRTLLRCLPRIRSVDVQAVLPGDKELAIGGDVRGVSRIRRENDRATPGVAWVQARTRIAVALLAEADTARLAAALPMLSEAADLVRQVGTAAVTGRPPDRNCDQRIRALHHSGRNLRPPYGQARIGDTAILEQKTPDLKDDLYGLVVSITGNVIPRFLRGPSGYRELAAYIAGTVIGKELDGVISEPWQLVGISGHPRSLDDLRTALENLCEVVDELANDGADTERIRRSALAGASAQALRRAAETCRRAKTRRQQKRRQEVQAACQATGLRANVFDSAHGLATTIEYRVSVELGSLFEWRGAVEELEAALRPNQRADETYLFVPLRHNRPVPGQAMKLIFSLWSDPNPDGLDKLPDPHSSELADTFDQAQRPLQQLSGICCLRAEQRTQDKVQNVIEELVSQSAAACEKLRELPDNPVVDGLLSIVHELAVRVQAENADTSTEPNLAAQTTPLDHDEITDEFQMITHANLIALEWDIDPQAATELYLSIID